MGPRSQRHAFTMHSRSQTFCYVQPSVSQGPSQSIMLQFLQTDLQRELTCLLYPCCFLSSACFAPYQAGISALLAVLWEARFLSFLASFWSLKSRPPMQSALRVAFGTLSCCILRHLLRFVLCMFSPLPGWHFRPPCRSLGGLLFELSGVLFASGITYGHAIWILPRFWLTFCFCCSTGAVESRKAVQVFGIRLQPGMFPRTGTCA